MQQQPSGYWSLSPYSSPRLFLRIFLGEGSYPTAALVVEESGNLTELGYLIDDYGKQYFDVLHLTGHATLTENGEPRFYTETETGEAYLASAEDIAKPLKSRITEGIGDA